MAKAAGGPSAAPWRGADARLACEAEAAARVVSTWLEHIATARERHSPGARECSATCALRDQARARLQDAIECGLERSPLPRGRTGRVPRGREDVLDRSDDRERGDEAERSDEKEHNTNEQRSDERDAAWPVIGSLDGAEMPLVDAVSAAATIEDVLFWRWRYTQPGVYHHKCRMLEHNLALHAWRLLTRHGPETVCVVPASALCEGSDLASWRLEHRRRVVADLKPPTPRSSTRELGIFRCPKCGGRHTTHYSMQTRSADEPMTNFVSCLDCLIRFKR